LLRAEVWPCFIKECLRVTRQGGYLRLIEPEWEATTSPAFEQLKRFFLEGLRRRGQCLSTDEKHIGVAFQLGSFLVQAGATDVSQRFSLYDYWVERQRLTHPDAWFEMMLQSVRPLLLRQKILKQSEFARFVVDLTAEVISKDFAEVACILSVCGRKPDHICENLPSPSGEN
jgi:hypothetical protein